MVNGIEQGSVGDTLNWKGSLDIDENVNVDGTLQVDGAANIGGTLSAAGFTVTGAGATIVGYPRIKVITLAATNWTTGTNNNQIIDTGWDIPAGSVVRGCYLIQTAADATETLNVGTTDSAPTEFLNGVSLAGTGIITGKPTIQTTGTNIDRMFNNDCTIGSALVTFVAGVDAADKTQTAGFFIPKLAYYAAPTSVYYQASAGTDTAAFSIVIEYVV
jgi:hypothetical protein